MSAGFTRAPWMAAGSPSSVVGWPVVSCGAGPGAGRSIASVSWMPGLPDEMVAEIRANANLIAASPRLYAALEKAIADLRTVGDDYPGSSCHKWCHERADEAEAALTLARG